MKTLTPESMVLTTFLLRCNNNYCHCHHFNHHHKNKNYNYIAIHYMHTLSNPHRYLQESPFSFSNNLVERFKEVKIIVQSLTDNNQCIKGQTQGHHFTRPRCFSMFHVALLVSANLFISFSKELNVRCVGQRFVNLASWFYSSEFWNDYFLNISELYSKYLEVY